MSLCDPQGNIFVIGLAIVVIAILAAAQLFSYIKTKKFL